MKIIQDRTINIAARINSDQLRTLQTAYSTHNKCMLIGDAEISKPQETQIPFWTGINLIKDK
jgi:hypothetical protein